MAMSVDGGRAAPDDGPVGAGSRVRPPAIGKSEASRPAVAVGPSRPAAIAAGPARPAAIELARAGKRFGPDWVVRDLSFRVERGAIFGLFGPSGAGKSTTIRLILGLLRPDEGEVRVLDSAPESFDARQRARLGYMPQLFVLYPELSVGHNLSLVASIYRLGWWKRRKPIRRVLELVELQQHRRKAARDLSGGMQRRLQLAAALLHEPELLVVDEPTAGIDPILRQKFWEHFHALRDEGRTLVVTSQYVTEAEHCDRVAVLAHGRILASGTPDELRRQAMGGEVVDVVTDGLTEPALQALTALRGVRLISRLSHEQLQLTVEQAAAIIPPALEVLAAHGVGAREVREVRPSFEDVFVRLVGAADAARLA